MHRSTTYVVAVAIGALVAMGSTLVSLERGLSAAATAGKPMSAKFEAEEGKLELSVYVEKDGTFSEVAVDHVMGSNSAARLVPL